MSSSRENRVKPFRSQVSIWGILGAAGAVACTATVLGYLGRFYWFLDLFSHFRPQYFIGLSALGLLFFFGRQRRAAAVFLLMAGMNLPLLVPMYLGSSPAERPGLSVHRAMLINVNTQSGSAEQVGEVIGAYAPDILVLEEINDTWVDKLSRVLQSYPHSEIRTREDNFGIALFSKFPFRHSEISYIGEVEVPTIMAEIEIPGSFCTVIATHPLPPGGGSYSRGRNDQLEKLPAYMAQTSFPVLLLGDLNVTPWNYYFRQLLKHSGLKDSSRGRGIQPTWPVFNPFLRIPIDHCLHSPEIDILRKEIGPNVNSDHYPVIVDFAVNP